MKTTKLITAALLALGLVSSVHASSTFGTTNVVYITGSTAFRANLWSTLTNNLYSVTLAPTVFDTNQVLVITPTSANSGTSDYNIEGTISGNHYLISVDLTGSEAGIASLYGTTISYAVPINMQLGKSAAGNVTLAGTPEPTTYIDPATGTADITADPDISFADTSINVSLSSAKNAVTPAVEYGCVGVVAFTWAKNFETTPDSSWTDLQNVTTESIPVELGSAQVASYFTGVAADTDKCYLIGRNEGSGTRVNMECDQFAAIALGTVKQYAVNNATYSGGNVLTVGTITALTSASTGSTAAGTHLVSVNGDGFDAGSGVAKTLGCDTTGLGILMVGYLGVSDANTVLTEGGAWLSENGVSESDGAIIKGQYSYWGHEHVYGVPGQAPTSPGGLVAGLLVGSNQNSSLALFSGNPPNGALEARGGFGGTVATAHSTAIDASLMHADKSNGSDIGFLGQY
jgi:hypothetical protein